MAVGVTSGRAHPGELRGIGLALVAMLLFGLMDAASKFLAARYPVSQIVWLRFVFTIPLALLLLPLLEIHQQRDGSVRIPEALRPYVNGLAEIRRT